MRGRGARRSKWVADEAPNDFPQGEFTSEDSTSVMGGGFDSELGRLFYSVHPERRLSFYARTLSKDTHDPAYGARMCADAAEYLWSRADRWGQGDRVRARVVAVGRSWSQDEIARDSLAGVLEQLLAREGAPEGLLWLQEGVRQEGVRQEEGG